MTARITKPAPTADQLAAVQAFAEKYGRRWKSELNSAWFDGWDWTEPDGNLLRQVRNQIGPQWLKSFKLPKNSQKIA